MAFSKGKLVIGALVALAVWLGIPQPALAQCLINIPDWSTGQVSTCLEPGGTIGLVGSYGNFGSIYAQTAEIVRQYNQTQSGNNRVTLEYRLYNDARPATAEEIQSVIAIIQQNPINAPTMLRVNNEWTDAYVWPGMNLDDRVANYLVTQHLAQQAINQSGGGIVLIDGMLDYWSGVDLNDIIGRVNGAIQNGVTVNGQRYTFSGWNRWADTFDVLAINGYFEPGRFGQLGNTNLSQVLGTLQQLAPGKPWRFSEFGYKLPGQRPTYDNPALLEQTIVDLVSWLANNPSYAQTFAGFNVFTRDPHIPDSANIAAAIMEIVASNPNLGSALAALENLDLQDPAAFQAWLDQLLQDGILVECKDTAGAVVGYAPTTEQCQVQLQMPQAPSNTCTAQGAEQSGLFRPAPCKNCSLDVPHPTNSCAEPFTLIRPETWTCGDLTGCPDPVKGRYFIKEVTWDADFFLNTQDTKVPFAGYRDIVTDEEDKIKNLNYYLADYFEGTTLLDGQPYDPTDPEQVRQGILNAGVFRKLAPLEVQDKLREQLILSGLNYEVSNGVDSPKHMQDFWSNRPLPPARYPSGYFPPDRNNPNYVELYRKWLDNPWGKLWQRIPLFTREDAPGKVTLAIEHNPGQLVPDEQAKAGRPLTSYSSEFPMAFPHLARTYEGSSNLNQLLMPTIQAARTEALEPPVAGQPIPCASIFGEGIETALGCLPTTAVGIASWFIQYGSSLAGGIAFLLMGYGAFLFITSAGNEEKIAQGKTIVTAAIIGLLVIVGGVFLLRLITVHILRIPGFTEATPTPKPAPIQLTAVKPLVALSQGVGTTVEQTRKAFASIKPSANQPVLLAQAEEETTSTTSTCNEMNIIQTVGQDGEIRFAVEETLGNNVNMNCYYRDTTATITYSLDGQIMGSCTGFFPIINNNPFDDYEDPLLTVCDPGLSVKDIGSRKLTASVSFFGGLMGGSGPECGGSDFSQSASCSCTTSFDTQGNPTTTCTTGAAQEEVKGCTNADNIIAACSGDDPQEDRNPNDPVCCDAQAHVTVPDYKIVGYDNYPDYADACLCDNNPVSPTYDPDCDPMKRHEVQMRREVSVKLRIPYLEEIWKDSTEDEFGFFNLFRPAHFPKFPDSDALSNIRYQLTSPGTTADPPVGELYYPYLGGIHQTKKCISEQFLLPKALQPETNYCQFWDDYLRYQSTYDPD